MAVLPEGNEIVLCTVKKILPHSIFLSLDNYPDAEGMLHISEISSSWVKNIKDVATEGKNMVCKVIGVNTKMNQVDLSLRKLKDFEKKEFLKKLKKERKIEKIVSVISAKLKLSEKETQKIKEKIIKEYETFSDFFDCYEEHGDSVVKELKLSSEFEKEITPMLELAKEKKKIVLKYDFNVLSTASDGIEKIKEFFKELTKKYHAEVAYLGSGRYHVRFSVTTTKEIKKLVADVEEFCKKKSSKEFKAEFKENE